MQQALVLALMRLRRLLSPSLSLYAGELHGLAALLRRARLSPEELDFGLRCHHHSNYLCCRRKHVLFRHCISAAMLQKDCQFTRRSWSLKVRFRLLKVSCHAFLQDTFSLNAVLNA
jgi:hypothetical protein